MTDAIERLSQIEQNIQHMLVQKRSLQNDLLELESALEELNDAKVAYRIVGNIMVEKKPEILKSEVTTKKDLLLKRIDAFETQEAHLRKKAQSIQEEVMNDQ